jgi:hypothetical protein
MATQDKHQPADAKQPAQVPGDAESPPKGETSQTIRDAIRQSDPTEPVQTGRSSGEKKPR